MTTKGDKAKLKEEIDLLRKKLEEYINNAEHPTESQVVKVSQDLDELIVAYYGKR